MMMMMSGLLRAATDYAFLPSVPTKSRTCPARANAHSLIQAKAIGRTRFLTNEAAQSYALQP
jgi:hypothetical protein